MRSRQDTFNPPYITRFFLISIFLLLASLAFAQTCNPQVKVFKIASGNAESLSAIAQDLLTQQGTVSFDNNSNSIIVFDCPQNIERIAAVIKELDVREKEVEIKVLVTEASSSFLEGIGLVAGQVIIPKGQFEAVLELIKESKETNIRAQMMVRTLSNHPAAIQVTKEEIIGFESIIIPGQAVVTSAIREPMGSLLEVLPSVNNDGTIKVLLQPSVTSIDEDAAPSQRTVFTQALVKSGDTIVIGGAETQKKSRQGLASSENRRVAIFLTCRIID